MKKNQVFAFVFCAVLFVVLGFGCSNGSTDSPPKDLPSGWQTMSYEDWDAWSEEEGNMLSEAEQEEFIQYIQDHFDELNADGQKWWAEAIAGMTGTNKKPTIDPVAKTIQGLKYSKTETNTYENVEENITIHSTHYLLAVDETWDEALETFTEFFGFQPRTGWNIRIGSELSSGTGWVIFEETDDDFRLVQYGDPKNIGVGWNKQR